MNTRRDFIKNTGWACAALTATQSLLADEAESLKKVQSITGSGLITVQPWIQLMGDNKLGVGWLTSKAADGMVEWTQDEEDAKTEWKRAWHVEDGLRQANGTSQRAEIEDYDPGKPIRIKAISRPIESFKPYKVIFGNPETSEIRHFPALIKSNGQTSFAVFNDIHNRLEIYPVLFDKAGKDLDFVVLNGDIVQDPQNEQQLIDYLLEPMSKFASRSLPCYFGRGNHETRGAFARSMKQYLCLPENRYYSAMTFGAMRIVFLDSGEDKPDNSKEYSNLVEFDSYIETQLEWLQREIASDDFKSARWRIVVVHIPPNWKKDESKLWHADRIMRERFAPLFDKGKMTAVICGHTHQMEFVEPCPEKKRGFQWPVFIGGAPVTKEATVIRVDVDNQSLRIKELRSDGSVFAEKSWK